MAGCDFFRFIEVLRAEFCMVPFVDLLQSNMSHIFVRCPFTHW